MKNEMKVSHTYGEETECTLWIVYRKYLTTIKKKYLTVIENKQVVSHTETKKSHSYGE